MRKPFHFLLILSLFSLILIVSCNKVTTSLQGPLPGMEFVRIPAGSFIMGSPEDAVDRGRDEGPLHEVHVPAFEIMTTEVTQGMWYDITNNILFDQRDKYDAENDTITIGDDVPMVYVSWIEVQEFIDELNDRDRTYLYRLPTEAEYEYAMRAGTTTRFYNGDSLFHLNEIAWWEENSHGTLYPVKQLQPNAWGLYDMAGNADEWVQDIYHTNYEGAPTDGSAWMDPGEYMEYRVTRGGAFCYGSRCATSANRYANPAEEGILCLGFRLARTERGEDNEWREVIER